MRVKLKMFNTVLLFDGSRGVPWLGAKLNGDEPWEVGRRTWAQGTLGTLEARYYFLAFLQSNRHCGPSSHLATDLIQVLKDMSRCHHNHEVCRICSYQHP